MASGIVPVSVLPTTRPELGGPSTLSTVLTGPSRDPVLETLNNCNRAMLFSAMMDSDLFNSGFVSTTHRQLPEMERKVLDLAAATDVVQGVFYSIAFTKGSEMFVRYFESGCFSGIMPSMSSVLQESDSTVTQLFPYRIFTQQDLNKKVLQQKKAAASRSKSRVKQNGPTDVPNRQRYSQYFNSRYSVCKVVFDKLSMLAQSEDISNKLQVSSVIFHCVKKNADENHIRDRPLHIFGLHHPHTLLQVLQHHRIHGNHVVDDPVDFSSLKEEISVEEEFHILSSVSNYHWDNDQIASYMQYFSTYNEDTRKYPTSLRNKIIFNFRIGCQEKYRQSVKMLSAQHAQGNSEDSTHSSQTTSMQPPQKRRRIANRVRRVTPENFALSLNLSEHIVTSNVAQPSSLFDNFSTRLIEGGTILWQSHSFTKDVLIMSDYCPESGKFKPQSYCKVTMLHEEEDTTHVQCSCSVYKMLLSHVHESAIENEDTEETYLDTSGVTCMHARFVKEYVLQDYHNLFSSEFQPESDKDKKLRDSMLVQNQDIVLVAESPRVTKYSVKGRNESVEFVHVNNDNWTISCQSGLCSVGKSKTVKNLEGSERLCPHLLTMKENQQLWIPSTSTEELTSPSSSTFTVKSNFNVDTGFWDFGSLSKHIPTAESCPKYRENIHLHEKWCFQHQTDESGFVSNILLCPALPENCSCGGTYHDVQTPDGINLLQQYSTQTTLYTRLAPIKATVCYRKCSNGKCLLYYTGEEEGIHFWSKETAVVDELCHDFLYRITSFSSDSVTFTGYCKEMDRMYKSRHNESSFMSQSTFNNCFFSWAVNMKIDFRKIGDPFCKSPEVLACDGTHVGVAFRHIRATPIERSELDEEIPVGAKRFDRVFLPYSQNTSKSEVQIARMHLKHLAKATLHTEHEDISQDTIDERSDVLIRVAPHQCKQVLQHFVSDSYDQHLKEALAPLLKLLGSDASVSAVIPPHMCDKLKKASYNILNKCQLSLSFRDVKLIRPEIHHLLQSSYTSQFAAEIHDFIVYLADYAKNLVTHLPAYQDAHPIPNSYNPESGVVYHFTESGEQVRKLPIYNINKISKTKIYDDPPAADERCNKDFPRVSTSGHSSLFFWFCPIHGHCLGFHIIPECEGRKVPFASMFKYLPEPPTHVFYDFACSLSEYCLNREPSFFKDTRFFHDYFHGCTHVCGDAFKSSVFENVGVNTEICEQFNSFLQNIKATSTHLSQSKFCFLLLLVQSKWNERNTEMFHQRLQVAFDGSK